MVSCLDSTVFISRVVNHTGLLSLQQFQTKLQCTQQDIPHFIPKFGNFKPSRQNRKWSTAHVREVSAFCQNTTVSAVCHNNTTVGCFRAPDYFIYVTLLNFDTNYTYCIPFKSGEAQQSNARISVLIKCKFADQLPKTHCVM